MKILMLLAVVATVDSKTDVPEPRRIAEQVMQRVIADDIPGFFEIVGRNMPVEKEQFVTMRENVTRARADAKKTLGPMIGYSPVSECRRGDYLVRYIYVEKRARTVIRWQFIFYRARDKWMMSLFLFDQNLASLFAPCESGA